MQTRRALVRSQADISLACQLARGVAGAQGLDSVEQDQVVLAVSELATNLVRHTAGGEIILHSLGDDGSSGVAVESVDDGPGIPDLRKALTEGYSTSGGFGSGLSVIRRQMDEMEIETGSAGTRIVARKWHRNR